ncbi:MAG: phosphoesterase [Methanosarcinales archaeon]|nr:phosphoesterase [Methanosarcinales archaeon]
MHILEAEFAGRISNFQRILYLCHRSADPDAIGSAFALQQAFFGDLGVVGDVSRTAGRLVEVLGASPILDPDPGDYDLVVVVDTSTWLQLGSIRPTRYAVIDHHQDTAMLEGAEFYIHRPANSTAEIVWQVLKQSAIPVTRESALGLLVGIISDTGRFKHAQAASFLAVGELLEAGGIEYGEALSVLSRMPSELSQRIAILKAASRAQIEWSGEWVVMATEVSAFEGSSAMALVDLGADVAFAAGRHGGVCRASGRARYEATEAGLDLSEIMREVAASFGGDGGGHRGAAALEAACPPAQALRELKRRALQKLSSADSL